MFLLAIALIPLLLSGIWYLFHLNAKRYDRASDEEYHYEGGLLAFSIFLLFLTSIPVIASMVVTMVNYGDQVSDAEQVVQLRNMEFVYQERANELVTEFQVYLADIYPEHEREIFSNISPDNIDIYLVKFPEIRASETIIELVKQIRSLKDAVYAQKIRREEVLKDMRYRTKNPWIYYWFIPEVSHGQ